MGDEPNKKNPQELPAQWRKSETSLRAVQLVFEFNKNIAEAIRRQALAAGLSPSDQIRDIIGLPVKKPQRPRLTVSLSEDDYTMLGRRYGIPAEDKPAIRQAVADEILQYGKNIGGQSS